MGDVLLVDDPDGLKVGPGDEVVPDKVEIVEPVRGEVRLVVAQPDVV